MPYLGLSSFLLHHMKVGFHQWTGFQCPTSGFLLFYGVERCGTIYKFRLFQCPTSGFLLFYGARFKETIAKLALFQCPTSGFLLFYQYSEKENVDMRVCFNALPRAFFFSTIKTNISQLIKRMFQCPTSGFLLFYLKQRQSGLPKQCFNALPRAFFFSTLCLCIPWIYWLCKSIFACNYLTISFSTIFLMLFSLFIF